MNFRFLFFVLSHFGFLGLLALFACLIGARVSRKIPYHSLWEKYCFSIGLGLGIIASAVFLLGLAHLLIPAVVLALFGFTAFLLWPTWKELQKEAQGAWREVSRKRLVLYASVFVLLSPVLLLPLYPPIHWDATAYHLAAAKIYATSHAVVYTPYLRFPVFPQLNEMLFTLALLLYDDLIAQLVQFLMMVVIALTIYSWGRRAFSARAGLWGAVLWLSNPIVLWLGTSAYIDVSLAMFLTLAAYAFFNWFQSRSSAWLLAAAALFGFSAGVKYLALFPILVVGLLLVYLSVREHTLRNVVAFGAIVLAVAGPWYLRNAYYTGNPIWPYWGSFLGYGPWTANDAANQISDQFQSGAGQTPGALLLLPWNLAFQATESFRAEYPVSPIFLCLLPLCLLAAVRDSYLRALLIATGLYTLFWFSTAQQLRYLLQAFPLLSLAGGAALGKYVFHFRWTQSRAVAPVLTGLGCILLAAPGWQRAAELGGYGRPLIPEHLPPARAKDQQDYIRRFNPLYSAVEFLNRTKGDDYTVYTVAYSNLAYYADGRFIGDWFGPA